MRARIPIDEERDLLYSPFRSSAFLPQNFYGFYSTPQETEVKQVKKRLSQCAVHTHVALFTNFTTNTYVVYLCLQPPHLFILTEHTLLSWLRNTRLQSSGAKGKSELCI